MKLRLNVDGKIYEVEVEILEEAGQHRGPSRPAMPAATAAAAPVAAVAAAAPPAPAANTGPADASKAFPSPISGVVVRVSVEIGQTVEANQELIVLEAMKMETVLTSQIAGKIAKINANVGDSVQVKQTLIEYE